MDAAEIEHSDPKHPRVKKWVRCKHCKLPTPKYKAQVDHEHPIVPITSSLEDMTWDEVVNRTWCNPQNLQVMCKDCHKGKTLEENRFRRAYKKQKKAP